MFRFKLQYCVGISKNNRFTVAVLVGFRLATLAAADMYEYVVPDIHEPTISFEANPHPSYDIVTPPASQAGGGALLCT